MQRSVCILFISYCTSPFVGFYRKYHSFFKIKHLYTYPFHYPTHTAEALNITNTKQYQRHRMFIWSIVRAYSYMHPNHYSTWWVYHEWGSSWRFVWPILRVLFKKCYLLLLICHYLATYRNGYFGVTVVSKGHRWFYLDFYVDKRHLYMLGNISPYVTYAMTFCATVFDCLTGQ